MDTLIQCSLNMHRNLYEKQKTYQEQELNTLLSSIREILYKILKNTSLYAIQLFQALFLMSTSRMIQKEHVLPLELIQSSMIVLSLLLIMMRILLSLIQMRRMLLNYHQLPSKLKVQSMSHIKRNISSTHTIHHTNWRNQYVFRVVQLLAQKIKFMIREESQELTDIMIN